MNPPRQARTLLASGRAVEAIELLKRHLEDEPTDAQAWNDVAEAMLTIGQGSGAVPAAHQAWALTRTPDAACLMAVALAQAGRAPDALQLIQAAITERPGTAVAWLRIARALELMGAHDSALDARWQAVVRAPRDPGLAATMAERLECGGRRREARAVALNVLEEHPEHPLANRVVVRLDAAEGRLDAASSRIRGLLLGGRMPASATSALWKDLARVEAARGNADDAFMAATVGNAQALLAWSLAHGAPSSRVAAEALALLEATPNAVSHPATGVPDIAFLVGFPGRALEDVRAAFSAHPEIVTVRDPLLEVALEEVLPGRTGAELLADLEDAAVCASIREVWRREVARRVDPQEGLRIVDASPLNGLRVDVLARVFPGAPLLGVLRDPRDAVLDAFLDDFDGSDWRAPLAELPTGAEMVAYLARLWTRARGLYAACTDLHYEAIQEFPRRTLGAALARLGLDWDEACAEPPTHEDLSLVGSVRFGTLRIAADPPPVGRWVAYQSHLLSVLPTLADAVRDYGYAGTPAG